MDIWTDGKIYRKIDRWIDKKLDKVRKDELKYR